MQLAQIEQIHTTAVEKGFYDSWEATPEQILAKLALIHSEVSEVLEAYRKQQGSAKILEEFADIYIRCYDLLVALFQAGVVDTFDLDRIIAHKMGINQGRDHKHGNLL